MNKLQTNKQLDKYIKWNEATPESFRIKNSTQLLPILDNTFAEDCMEAQEIHKYLCMDIDTAH